MGRPARGRGRTIAGVGSLLCCLTVLSGAAPAALADVVSTFDTDDEGWVVEGDPTTAFFVPTGGNPDGYVSATDSGSGDVMYWSAPAKFLGDVSEAYGNSLSFDLRQDQATNPFEDSDVILESGKTTLHFDTPTNPGTTFTNYVVPMTEAGWHLDSLTGPLATQEQFLSVLTDLTKLRIRAEYRSGVDTDDLDNVILGAPTDLPDPVLGVSVNLRPVSGVVTVDIPGDDQGFIPIEAAVQVPVTSKVNTRQGRVLLSSAKQEGGTQSALFYDGLFQIRQGTGSDLTKLRLRERPKCSGARGERSPRASRKRKPGLWGSGNGNFSTQGNHGSASVRGTEWLLFEACGGITGTTVKEGVVAFRNFYTRKTTLVRAGQTVLARPPKR